MLGCIVYCRCLLDLLDKNDSCGRKIICYYYILILCPKASKYFQTSEINSSNPRQFPLSLRVDPRGGGVAAHFSFKLGEDQYITTATQWRGGEEPFLSPG